MFELYKHQKIALSYLRIYNSFALFMEQGCGKTLPCLCRALELAKKGLIRNVLVVAPKAAKGAWTRDIELFNEADGEILRNVLTVVNYESIWRKTDLDKQWLRSKKYDSKQRGDYEKVWDMIILDESHKIKNRTSIQAIMAHRLSLSAKYRYILTGTPICNGSMEDIWSQFAFLKPYVGKRGAIYSEIFGGSYYDFLDYFAVLNQWHSAKLC